MLNWRFIRSPLPPLPFVLSFFAVSREPRKRYCVCVTEVLSWELQRVLCFLCEESFLLKDLHLHFIASCSHGSSCCVYSFPRGSPVWWDAFIGLGSHCMHSRYCWKSKKKGRTCRVLESREHVCVWVRMCESTSFVWTRELLYSLNVRFCIPAL